MLATIFKLNCLEIVGRRHLVAPFNKRINAPSPALRARSLNAVPFKPAGYIQRVNYSAPGVPLITPRRFVTCL